MRKNFITNPINFVLQSKYKQSVSQLTKFKNLCIARVLELQTNRGSTSVINELLEEHFPHIETHFPINGWQQRQPTSNGGYSTVVVSKDYESSLNSYVKSITIATRAKRPSRRTEKAVSNKLILEEVVSPSPIYQDDETMRLLDYALQKGAKLFRKGDLEIQF